MLRLARGLCFAVYALGGRFQLNTAGGGGGGGGVVFIVIVHELASSKESILLREEGWEARPGPGGLTNC